MRHRTSSATLVLGGTALLSLIACDRPADEAVSGAETAATPATPAAADTRIRDIVRTTFHPTTYWAERIAGGQVAVENPVPRTADPIFWAPTREAITAYQQSRLIIVNGAEFERWVGMTALPESRVVETTRDFDEPFIRMESTTHAHGPTGEHSHEGVDGHTWMDPINAIRQATTLAEAMKDAWPQYADQFDANLAGLVADLEELDAQFRAITPRLENVILLAAHPAYNYIARRYGWDITNLDLDPDNLLSGPDLRSINEAIPEDRDPSTQVLLLWESEPMDEMRQLLFADMRVESIVFRPAETISEEEWREDWHYMEIMRDNLNQLAGILPPA